jgi:hypothetical protein
MESILKKIYKIRCLFLESSKREKYDTFMTCPASGLSSGLICRSILIYSFISAGTEANWEFVVFLSYQREF